MADFRPFRGFLPRADEAKNIVSRPFDTYSKDELLETLKKFPHSFLHVIMPYLPDQVKEISYHERLLLGKAQFKKLCKEGAFIQEAHPSYFLYRQTHLHEQYIGIIGAISIDDCLEGVVKPHEQTIEDKEVRLKNYLEVVDINAEPVVMSYKAEHAINEFVDRKMIETPDIDFHFPGFGHHEIWKINDTGQVEFLRQAFTQLNEIYIADGHHRTASSVLLGEEKRKQHPNYTGDEPFNHFMAILFPHHQIRLREFNRLVHDLNGLSAAEFLHRLKKDFFVEEYAEIPDISAHAACFALYMDHTWYMLQMKPETYMRVEEKDALPTQMLTDFILSPILEIHDLRKDKRIAFIGGKTNAQVLEQKVDSGEFKAAFVVNKITIPQFKRFADNGWSMPPKSTYFEPKLLNGLVIYSLEG